MDDIGSIPLPGLRVVERLNDQASPGRRPAPRDVGERSRRGSEATSWSDLAASATIR